MSDRGPLVKSVITLACHAGIKGSSPLRTASFFGRVDKIDGDATNNHPDNFQLVCPNCDSQSDTFGAKNTGKGRKSRGLPQYG